MHRKHILFYSNHLRGPKGSAGARSWHQTREISNKYKVTVIIPAIDPVTSKLVTDEAYEGLNKNVKVIKIWTIKNIRSSKIYRALFFLSAVFSQFFHGLMTKKPDLILTMSLPITMLAVSYVVAKIKKVPLVIDVRDLPFEMAKEIGYIKSKWLVKLLKFIENKIFRSAALISTNSPRYKPYLVNYGIPKEKIIVTPIGYDDFPEPSKELLNSWRKVIIESFEYPPTFIAVFAGTLGYAIPAEELLNGASKLSHNKDIAFLFLGDGQKLEMLKKKTLDNNVNAKFLGRVAKNDVHAICRLATVCLYPSEEGEFSSALLGNKVFDYLGANKPIIYIGPNSAVSDVITELNAGVICPPYDPSFFSNVIKELFNKPELIEKYSSGASNFRKAGYTALNSASILNQKITTILNNS